MSIISQPVVLFISMFFYFIRLWDMVLMFCYPFCYLIPMIITTYVYSNRNATCPAYFTVFLELFNFDYNFQTTSLQSSSNKSTLKEEKRKRCEIKAMKAGFRCMIVATMILML